MAIYRIIRKPELIEITGLSSATIYRRIAEGSFPRPVALGTNSVGWRSCDVESWLDNLQPVPIGPETQEGEGAATVLRLDDVRDRQAAKGRQP